MIIAWSYFSFVVNINVAYLVTNCSLYGNQCLDYLYLPVTVYNYTGYLWLRSCEVVPFEIRVFLEDKCNIYLPFFLCYGNQYQAYLHLPLIMYSIPVRFVFEKFEGVPIEI
jgi:hypothetical protein